MSTDGMNIKPAPGEEFTLGEYRVQPLRGRIEHDGKAVHVKPKAMSVLECLARAGGEVVTRDELFDAVWGRAIVSDATLSQCIVELRNAFGDTARESRVIETVPKVGFRLVPEVRAVPAAAVGNAEAPPGDAKLFARLGAWPWYAGAAVVLLALAFLSSWFSNGNGVGQQGQPKTLAVLPFVDMSPDQDQAHFADGITEELIHGLSQQDQLLVTGRTSSFSFKGRSVDLREAGRLLGVDHIVEGSVRKSGERFRITANLVEAASGTPLWSRTIERSTNEYFEIQQEITADVIAAMAIETGNLPRGHIYGTSSFEAYEHVMRALAGETNTEAGSLMRSLEHLRMAAEIDPEYAFAWGALAQRYAWQQDNLSQDWREISSRYLERALALDPDSPQLLKFAIYRHTALEDWAAAERVIETLMQDHQHIIVPERLEQLVKVGRAHEAVALGEQLYRRDPYSGLALIYLQHAYAMVGRTEEALVVAEELWAIWPGPEVAQEAMVTAWALDDPVPARRWLQRFMSFFDGDPSITVPAMAEHVDNPEFALEWLHFNEPLTPADDYAAQIWAARLGDPELALEYMRRSPEPWSFWMPFNAEVRRLDEFKDLLHEVGLVDYWREFGWGDYCWPVGEADFECGDLQPARARAGSAP